MKVLWLCNTMLPIIAEQLHIEASNKEGWLSGLADVMLQKREENGIELSAAFPAPNALLEPGKDLFEKTFSLKGMAVRCFGFREDVVNSEVYDAGIEDTMKKIADAVNPDVVHCFGTEFSHTLAMCKVFPQKDRILITLQGLCTVCAKTYFANLPEQISHSRSFRDWLKKDSMLEQRKKFEMRGQHEVEAVKLAGNIGGRTPWDRKYSQEWNPKAIYFQMNETLRSDFYRTVWDRKACLPHSIFLSQGDYPLKGFHYMLHAMPEILREYPDAEVYVAGNSIVDYNTLRDKIKICAYGKYLRSLIRKYGLEQKVHILGKLTGEQMKDRYLKSHLFVCPSSLENSPNSLGEAMLLGMPCISANVGGVPGIFTDGEDGILYEGCKENDREDNGERMLEISHHLAEAVLSMWQDEERLLQYCSHAREHAMRNHNREDNYAATINVYSEIVGKAGVNHV